MPILIHNVLGVWDAIESGIHRAYCVLFWYLSSNTILPDSHKHQPTVIIDAVQCRRIDKDGVVKYQGGKRFYAMD